MATMWVKRTFSDSISGVSGLMSAFLQSGRSNRWKSGEIRVRFRPDAVIQMIRKASSRQTTNGQKRQIGRPCSRKSLINWTLALMSSLVRSKERGPSEIIRLRPSSESRRSDSHPSLWRFATERLTVGIGMPVTLWRAVTQQVRPTK